LAQQIFTGAIDEAEAAFGIEGENGHVNLGHDGAEERGRFKSAEALDAQRFAELIDLEQHFAEGVIRVRAAGANRVITLAQGGEQVTHSLQRADDMLARAGQKTKDAGDNDQRQRPIDFCAEIAEPEERESGQHRGRAGRNGQPGQPSFMGKAAARFVMFDSRFLNWLGHVFVLISIEQPKPHSP